MLYVLGRADELNENKCKTYTITADHKNITLLVVRQKGELYAYENRCPHTGINLEWQPDQFLDITNKYIQCSTHGALFRINDGLCEWGPCLGKHLRRFNIKIQDGQLTLTLAHL